MSSGTILIADDERHITLVMTRAFEQAGYEVACCQDGHEALESAQQDRPTLIVTDFQMPGMSGMELCEALSQDPATAGIPIIMLSARGHLVSESDRARTGVLALLPKPFSAKDLVRLAQELIDAENSKDQAA